jgi:hypothetical protein
MIDYYTISGKNANTHFGLDLKDGYYNYNDVLCKINYFNHQENANNLLVIMEERKAREKVLREEFERLGIKFQERSYLVRRHIMYNDFSPRFVIGKMYQMKVLFENCQIKDKWEAYKLEHQGRIFSMDEKDKYYDDYYKNYLEEHPELRME